MNELSAGSPGGFIESTLTVPRPTVAAAAVARAQAGAAAAVATFAQASPEIWRSPAALEFIARLDEVRAAAAAQAEELEAAARVAAVHCQAVAATPLVREVAAWERGAL